MKPQTKMPEEDPCQRLYIESDCQDEVPLAELEFTLRTALTELVSDLVELSVQVVDEAASAELNERYRSKAGPTNVLSFPCDELDESNVRLLGDLVICHPVVVREAAEQGKLVNDHYRHMVIHGLLHLLGYDHQEAREAAEMESLEQSLLAQQGIANPYESVE